MQNYEMEFGKSVRPLFFGHTKIQNRSMPVAEDGLQQESVQSMKCNECTLCPKCNKGMNAQASLLNRSISSQKSQLQCMLVQMQKSHGNRYVQRVLEIARKGNETAEVNSEVETAIQGQRGGGQALASDVRAQMEPAFGSDFSSVRVHTDSSANSLNQHLNARAFTTGNDIFFRGGEYNPGNSSGRELLAHELTHVVQQTGGIQHKLTVGKPGDIYETEADKVAKEVIRQEHQSGTQRMANKEIYKQPIEDEEEEGVQAKEFDSLQRQVPGPVEEEEEQPM
ncbi:MAG: DUF4157 domain-containing protein [bacterium]